MQVYKDFDIYHNVKFTRFILVTLNYNATMVSYEK
jgi:hypothetical protein